MACIRQHPAEDFTQCGFVVDHEDRVDFHWITYALRHGPRKPCHGFSSARHGFSPMPTCELNQPAERKYFRNLPEDPRRPVSTVGGLGQSSMGFDATFPPLSSRTLTP